MMMNYPVRIPDVPGKLVYRDQGENRYVLFETNRRYDAERGNTRVERKVIGVQIPEQPELMFPNENYLLYFGGEDQTIDEKRDALVRGFEAERERGKMLRAFFDKVYFEFLHMSRKTPENPVSGEKVKRINRILKPLMEMMEGEEYAEFLELVPEVSGEGGEVSAKHGDGSCVPIRVTHEPSPCFAMQASCHEKIENDESCKSGETAEGASFSGSKGLTCSDVAILLTIFKTAVDRYFMERI